MFFRVKIFNIGEFIKIKYIILRFYSAVLLFKSITQTRAVVLNKDQYDCVSISVVKNNTSLRYKFIYFPSRYLTIVFNLKYNLIRYTD